MWSSARRFLESPLVRVFGALFVVLTIGCAFHADGAFLRFETHRDTWRELAVRGLLAAGLTPVILTGGIDLSVGSILGFSAVLFAKLSLTERWHPLSAVLVTLLAGVALGCGNGLLVALLKIQPFVATLATMTAARGLAKSLAGGRKISTAIERADGSFDYLAPPEFFDFCNGKHRMSHFGERILNASVRLEHYRIWSDVVALTEAIERGLIFFNNVSSWPTYGFAFFELGRGEVTDNRH